MGARFLLDLPDVLKAGGLNVKEVDGWEFRSRSSGGYNGNPTHVMWHHTASPTRADGWPDVNYMALYALYSPVCNLYFQRDGTVWVLAGGATNTNGRGTDTWGGGTPDNGMNSRAIGCEIGSDGVGETYPAPQREAVIKAAVALAKAYDIPVGRHRAHFEWAPTRKVDPAGPPTPWAKPGDQYQRWDMDQFREDLLIASMGGEIPTDPVDPVEPPSNLPPFNPVEGEYGLWPLNESKPTIKKGDKGDAVKYLQGVIFNEAGGDIVVDGDFGSETDLRVKDVQRFFKATVDGIVGPQTWAIIDSLTIEAPEEPTQPELPLEPPPGQKEVRVVNMGHYYVRPGDSPWSAAERIYGTGTKYENLMPTTPPNPGFNGSDHLIRTPGVGGMVTEVKSGEGPYSILKRMGKSTDKLQVFYDFNGGQYRVLQPGDLVFVP